MSAATVPPGPDRVQRPSAETLHAAELVRLRERDAATGATVPDGWALAPRSVVDFVLGDAGRPDGLGLLPKFVGERAFVERCVVALATDRGLMLVGEPGTAKSYLSELLAAAVSGDSTLTIQGSASTTDDAIKYSWNYALLLAQGPGPEALVPAPVHRGMSEGKVVRFEEITRCPIETQDSLLSVLSDRVLVVPELSDPHRVLHARRGFAVLATANIRDRGVNDMSAALKRRFNFETVQPIRDPRREVRLVQQQSDAILAQAGIASGLPADLTEVLVTLFGELRTGRTEAGAPVEQLSTAMSTAEAVQVAVTTGLQAAWFSDRPPHGGHLVEALLGTALKDSEEDRSRLRGYLSRVVKGRPGRWEELYAARDRLDG
ncbi:ATP-binding protein [Nocardioides sp. CPCC 205120]|uniref:ATP-binding protein n=1 Tax=Nocardioides sp. CPCC 205120 TaxID=3406462 RepID=UPI003B50E24E